MAWQGHLIWFSQPVSLYCACCRACAFRWHRYLARTKGVEEDVSLWLFIWCFKWVRKASGLLEFGRLIEWSISQFSRSAVSSSLPHHGLQHARPPCPSPTPRVYSNSCPSSRWCHPTISSSVVPFSSCLHSFPASDSFQMSQFFTSGGQSIGASASVLPMNTQDWSPLGWTGWISL